ncbi:MAG TPA: glycosyltransferase family 87 protein [Candidatus Dormibacteraeota bacterium]|nr:glycosyltransferase family 87 protein [Candidatus Dormibacteraeota bacterium]
MLDYLRRRTRLWAAAGLWTGILLIAFDLYAAVVTYIPEYRLRNDFRLMYGAAVAAWRSGYGHLYDLPAQKAATEGLGAGFYWQPYLNPPPLAWLVTPLTALPFGIAIWIWTVLLVGAAIFTWYVVAPGRRLTKVAHLTLFLGLFPTAFGLMVGQPAALVAAAVAASWWLARRDRQIAAGLVLSAIAIKPQLAILVPVCLLVAGRIRIFGAWLAATAVIAVVALVVLGPEGVQRYRDVLSLASSWEPTRRYAIAGPLGLGPQVYAAQALVVAVALAAARRQRGALVERPIATGIVASLLFTPYVGFQDFAMLVLAGWLVVRAGASSVQVALMVAGYALLELALIVLAVPFILAELLFLLTLIGGQAHNARVPAKAELDTPNKPRVPATAANPRSR